MTPPADPRETLRGIQRFATEASCPSCDGFVLVSDPNGNWIRYAALAGMCVLPVDVVETLVRYARGAIEAGPKALATLEPRERAMATQALEVLRYALAAAEAELAKVEARR